MSSTALLWSLAEWSVRAAVLAGCAGLALCLFRVRDVAVRLTAWTVVVAASLVLPFAAVLLPATEVPVPRWEQAAPPAPVLSGGEISLPEDPRSVEAASAPAAPARNLDVATLATGIWAAVALAMLAHLLAGICYGRCLVGHAARLDLRAAAAVLESEAVRVPVTIGSFRPVILLPPGWRHWEGRKLRAVLAHESAHVRRRDPLRQLAASVYRAVLWFHPLAWWVHRHLSELAEAASDDAAIAETADETAYAEILLQFFAAAPRRVQWDAVAMATKGKATKRMERVLQQGRKLSLGMTRGAAVALGLAAVPAVWFAASATPVWAVMTAQDVRPAPPAPPPGPAPAAAAAAPAPPAPAPVPLEQGGAQIPPQPAQAPQPPQPAVHAQPPAPPAPVAPPRPQGDGDGFAIVGPDGKVMGSHREGSKLREMAKGGELFWFRRAGDEYLVRDPALVAQARQAWSEVELQGRLMGEKGRAQGEIGRQFAEEVRRSIEPHREALQQLGAEMGRIGAEMGRSYRDDARMKELEAKMGLLEKQMNEKTRAMSDMNTRLNSEKFRDWNDKLSKEMEALGREMEGKVKAAQERMKAIEDEALRSRKAEKLL